MPNPNLRTSVQKAVAKKKAKPVAKPTDPMVPILKAMHDQISESAKMNKAVQDLVNKDSNITVTVDTAPIADAIKEGISEMAPPVVNIPERPRVSYQITSVEYDRKGNLSGARIHPVDISD